MKIYTIKQKLSNSGSIHDIASDSFDREIKFPEGSKYAVVLASYYGGRGYTVHKTVDAAIKASRLNQNYSHEIIDSAGIEYYVDGDQLVQLDCEFKD